MKIKSVIIALAIFVAAACVIAPATTEAQEVETPETTQAATTEAAATTETAAEPQLDAEAADYQSVDLTWTAVDTATGYNIYMSEDGDAWTLVKKIRNAATTAYTVSDITTGQKTMFKITTTGADKVSSEAVSVKTALAKTKVTGYAAGTRVLKISWKKVAGAQKYELYRKSGSGAYKKIKTTSGKSYSNRNLAPGKTYKYYVKAVRTEDGVKARTASASKKVKTPKKLTWGTKGFKKTNAYKTMKLCRSKLGCPYVSGASGPYSFDCSGYAYWINKTAGVSGKKFTRSSAQGEWSQIRKYSIGRSYNNAQPGDIVFISSSGSRGNITHVAFYYGNYKLIHATNPSVDVAITSVYWSGGPSKVVDIVRLPNM
ncbi:MAG: NlpC/P60 family protein [Anaerovoracaceae bacterium]|jgi:cell wall-associated NlpC family hydrolase